MIFPTLDLSKEEKARIHVVSGVIFLFFPTSIRARGASKKILENT
jgi:hypothetical protein